MTYQQPPLKKPFYYALGIHGAIFLFLIISSFTFTEKVFQEQSVNIINANALSALPSQAAPTPVAAKPEKTQPAPVPKPEKQIQRRTIQKTDAVDQTVVKNATIDKKEHLTKTKPHKQAPTHAEKLAHQKQLHAKQLAHQKQLAHEKEVAHEKAVAEQNHLKALHAAQVQGTIDRYQAMILQAISQNWMIPPGVDKQLTCTLNIQLGPDGSVLNVILSQSSGNVLLDRSAVAAVYKSSPLPVPKDADAFETFRNFDLLVKPEDIVS